MYIQYLGEIVPPPRHNTLGVCNQVTFPILYYNSSRLVALLEVINALYKFQILLILLLVSISSILAFKYAFFFFQKCLLESYLTLLIILSTLLWLGSCIYCILACFLRSKIPKHSSSNHGLCCCISCSPRLHNI
jgi:hypothetical protein